MRFQKTALFNQPNDQLNQKNIKGRDSYAGITPAKHKKEKYGQPKKVFDVLILEPFTKRIKTPNKPSQSDGPTEVLGVRNKKSGEHETNGKNKRRAPTKIKGIGELEKAQAREKQVKNILVVQ